MHSNKLFPNEQKISVVSLCFWLVITFWINERTLINYLRLSLKECAGEKICVNAEKIYSRNATTKKKILPNKFILKLYLFAELNFCLQTEGCLFLFAWIFINYEVCVPALEASIEQRRRSASTNETHVDRIILMKFWTWMQSCRRAFRASFDWIGGRNQ